MPKKPLPIASCLIFDDQNRLLLLRRHADDFGGGMWAPPGGKQEPDEESHIAAIRETKEETGLELSVVKYLGKHELRMPHGVVHIESFIARVRDNTDIQLNLYEHQEYAWFDPSKLATMDYVIWGLPTALLDFGLIEPFATDPTLADGSQAILLDQASLDRA